jgi:GNAT superfamily N-acetyltransferase
VELNTAEWIRLKGRLPWVDWHDEGDVQWIFAGDTYPQNTVILARFSPGSSHRRVAEVLRPHLQHRVACNWIVGPVSQPSDLPHHLRTNGLSCRLHCSGMACDLGALPPPPPMPAGVTVELIDSLPALAPLTTERRRRRHEGRTAMAHMLPRKVWCFSASRDGQPIGETTLIEGAGVAGLYDVEVLERFRRRGIGSALVDAALRQARRLGYRAAVLGATRAGSRFYIRRGFREVCKLSFWKYGKLRQLRGRE